MSRRIAIAGGGPGGLTCALALVRRGVQPVVFERAPQLSVAGAGLTVQVNAMRALASLGVAGAVIDRGCELRRAEVRSWTGTVLSRGEMAPLRDRFGQPSVAIHRWDLSDALLAALPDGTVRFGVGVAGVDERGRLELSDGTTLEADVVIGADGIHSVVRHAVFGPVAPVYSGYTCWRGIAAVDSPLEPGLSVESWGPGRRFGIVPIGRGRTYWFATQNAPPDERDGPDPRAEVAARFEDFAVPAADLVQASDIVLRHDILSLPPLPSWSRGCVTLLGDAAHAMTPNMGQGACMAIEDAVWLADALVGDADVVDALAAYEARRGERARMVAVRSERIGRLAQLSNGLARAIRDLSVWCTPDAVMTRQLAALYAVELPLAE